VRVGPAPPSTIDRTGFDAFARSIPSATLSITLSVRVFIFSGRFSGTIETLPFSSSRTTGSPIGLSFGAFGVGRVGYAREMDPLLNVRPLPGAPFGVEILDAKLATLLSPDAMDAWHAQLAEHQLVVFRELALEAEEQVTLLATLGEPLVENPAGRLYQFVSNTHNEGILGDERFAYHSDHAFMDVPIDVISLYGLEVPDTGTSTRFVNGVTAARALPADLREKLEGRRARHSIDPDGRHEDVAVRGPRRPAEAIHAFHPMLWSVSRNPDPVLYVSEQQSDLVEGLDEAESVALIERAFAHLYADDFSYAHRWREADLVLWDNRALQHARDAVPAGASRNLRRVSIGGTSVFEYFRDVVGWDGDAS